MITLILEVKKHFFSYCILLEIDLQTHLFRYPYMFVWISKHGFGCVLYRVSRGIHLTQMRPHNWLITLCIINKFEK